MSKPIPLQFGGVYHIFNRGNNRETIFHSEENYRYFLELYAKYVPPVAKTYAYCLLPNHFHLCVRTHTPEEQEAWHIEQIKQGLALPPFRLRQPSQQFGNLFNAYAKSFNRAFDRTGSLFQNPFGRIAVEYDSYAKRVTAYIHRNPQTHGLIDDFRKWSYSSYPALLAEGRTRLERETVLSWFGGRQGFEAYHRFDRPEDGIGFLLGDDEE